MNIYYVIHVLLHYYTTTYHTLNPFAILTPGPQVHRTSTKLNFVFETTRLSFTIKL